MTNVCAYIKCDKPGEKPLLLKQQVFYLYCINHAKLIRSILNHGRLFQNPNNRYIPKCFSCSIRKGKYKVALKDIHVCGFCFRKYYNHEKMELAIIGLD